MKITFGAWFKSGLNDKINGCPFWFAFKCEFNFPGIAMKTNISSAANSLTVDTMDTWFGLM